MFAGHVIVQGVPPVTVTVKLQVLPLPAGSDWLQFTVVVPIGKVEPDGGLHETGSGPQVPVDVGVE